MTTVLIVDDEPAVRTALRKLFERGGLAVLEADGAGAALARLAAEPAIEAVVSDYIMPELNGLELYDEMVRQAPRLRGRVVFLTGAAREPEVHQALEQRGVPLINKLDGLQIVLDAVRLALLRGRTG
jgi:CheY-like chemotaxis protein